jgi:predicted Zn finger-like uncharacterized protein
MIISCPNCNTRYAVPIESLGEAGRRVKCARCTHVWFQIRPEDPDDILDFVEPPQEIPDIPEYSNVPTIPEPVATKTTRLWYGAALCALLCISGSAAILGYPKAVVQAWPASARLYMTLGLPVPTLGKGLEFGNVVVRVFEQEGASALLVSGTITNTLDQPTPIPTLHLLVRDDNRRVLLQWLDQAPVEILEVGQSVTFYTQQLTNNPMATKLEVTFTHETVAQNIF